GDVIGYGPNPSECLDIVMNKCKVCILGNHDQAALFDPDGFNPTALRAIYWTRDQLDAGPGSPQQIIKRWDFLGERPSRVQEGDILYVHGSPRDPTNEYVFPEHIFDNRKMENLFARIDMLCFAGHTHIPGVFNTQCEFLSPEEIDDHVRLNGEKMLVNVGSVGQPRDEDPRSCYVILDTDAAEIRYHRVEYDIESTAAKIYKQSDLDNSLGDRIKRGQ
ncbi:MAG: metallophosphoesterase family protein, partial [Planctomycetota bacterium]